MLKYLMFIFCDKSKKKLIPIRFGVSIVQKTSDVLCVVFFFSSVMYCYTQPLLPWVTKLTMSCLWLA